MSLTEKQKRFCEEYLVDLNATQAYKRAGYSVSNNGAAESASSRLLSNVKVQTYIAELRADQQRRTAITADKVIIELAHVAMGRISNVVKVRNNVVEITDFDKLEEQELAAIAAVKQDQIVSENHEQFKTSITMHNKVKALELLGKHLGLFQDVNMAIACIERYGGTVSFETATATADA